MSHHYENMFETLIATGQFKVTRKGEVWKFWRRGPRGEIQRFKESRLICSPDRKGNMFVEIRVKSKSARVPIPRIVWRHFKGKISKGLRVYHKDGDRSNNAISNLYVDP